MKTVADVKAELDRRIQDRTDNIRSLLKEIDSIAETLRERLKSDAPEDIDIIMAISECHTMHQKAEYVSHQYDEREAYQMTKDMLPKD